ncbi:MAG: hypothetical protein WC091_24650 [Sulfuricellaceae bacterium]
MPEQMAPRLSRRESLLEQMRYHSVTKHAMLLKKIECSADVAVHSANQTTHWR